MRAVSFGRQLICCVRGGKSPVMFGGWTPQPERINTKLKIRCFMGWLLSVLSINKKGRYKPLKMATHLTDTIFSLSSAPGRAGVSVFRVSGPRSADILAAIIKSNLPRPRQASLKCLYNEDLLIDEALVLWMPGPGSFTGEDCAEFQVHGSLAVIEAVGTALLASGARQAEAGEFTRRAFENDKMDLTEAEGLADLIDAETEGQRRQALRQMQGGLRDIYIDWKEKLLDALAQIEGEIDFPDEEDVPDMLSHRAYPYLSETLASMKSVLDDANRGERVRAGLDIAIIGAPNAGKSSLINNLAGRNVAITSEIEGTTRDILEVQMNLGGLPVRLSDTAGLRQTSEIIEAEGVKRAMARALESDIRIFVQDGTNETWDMDALKMLTDKDFVLLNKSDLRLRADPPTLSAKCFEVSATTGQNLDVFRKALEVRVIEEFSPSQVAGLTRARHRDCVERGVKSLEFAMKNLALAPELAGDDIRSTLHALKELSGEIDIESVFDRIFSRFCIGK